MKKILLTGIVYFMSVSAAVAQAGYRDFTFGMTVEQVKSRAPDAIEWNPRGGSIPGIYALFMYLYNADVGSRYSSAPEIRYTETLYLSEKEELMFTFVNNKLYGVDVYGLSPGVLADLKSRYGDREAVTLNDYDSILVDTAAWNDGRRFIVYCKYSDYTTGQYYRTIVFYYDANYLTPLLERAMQNFRASRSSRLD